MTTHPTTITIDDVQYIRADTAPATPTEWRIIIAQRGWVFVGRYECDGDDVTLSDAKVIRTWGTTKGLGELRNGPLASTKTDECGTVRLHRLAVVASLDVKGWS